MRYRPIRRNNEFGRVYARGKSYVNQALVLYVLKTRGKKTRVGLTATKKIGHAVQRGDGIVLGVAEQDAVIHFVRDDDKPLFPC